jgi:hypothetical protein
VLQRPTPKANFRRTNFKSSEKAPPLQKPQGWATQLQRLNFKGQFQGQRDKDLKKKNGINNFVYPVLALRKIVPWQIAVTSWPASADRLAHQGDALDNPADCRARA